MANRLTVVYLIFLFFPVGETQNFMDIPTDVVENWANAIGQTIRQLFRNLTSIDRIQKRFQTMNGTVRKKDGNEMIRQFSDNITDMLRQKHKAVQRLVDVAEKSNAAHEFNQSLQLDYPRAKHLRPDFVLTPNKRLNNAAVNTSFSTVHLPTNLYDQSSEVLNGIGWSNALDDVFRSNYESDPTIGWQYFSSSVGYFRIFPGTAWSIPPDSNGVDFFDARTRSWYIEAATSPKDVVVLVDSSGSMTGQRMAIARMTVRAVIDTLCDDDFFNVITYSETPSYIDDCFNGTLIQANGDNKQRIQKSLMAVRAKDVAQLESGLIEAFAVLRRMDQARKGAMCNKAIIIISDDVIATYQEIFEHYNRDDKKVRVFVYLIGRDVINISPARHIACNNKGYVSVIATSADITENVQRYVRTLARPMVLSQPRVAVWTSAYLASNDANDQEMQLMTTLSQPAFDTRPEANVSGNLLGVLGTDVPMQVITNLIPPHKLGVNGYAFAITNNGYIIFHPDFRPLDGGKPKPSYNSVDLTEVEISEEAFQLEAKMVGRQNGNMTMKTMMHCDQLKRVSIRTNHYYFAPIGGTPFSLGIVLPDGYGLNWFDGRMPLDITDFSKLQDNDAILASWIYCTNVGSDIMESRLSALQRFLTFAQQNRSAVDNLCDVDLVERLVFDVEATLDVVSWWRGSVEALNHLSSGSVRSIFVGTSAGLTRFWRVDANADFPRNKTTSISELYYTRAVENGNDIITVSTPFHPVNESRSVTMSCPIVVAADNGSASAVAAAAGIQTNQAILRRIFFDATASSSISCILNCHSNRFDCYLVDNNGFVVVSRNQDEVGRFLGEFEPTLMLQLHDDRNNSQFIYRSVIFYDYQSVCLLYTEKASAAPPSPLSPIKVFVWLWETLQRVTALVLRLLNELISTNWSLKSVLFLWSQSDFATAETESKPEPIMCDRPLNMFYAANLSNATNPSGNGSILNCPGKCNRAFAFSHVPGTNLFLIVADATCSCVKEPPISAERLTVHYNDSTMCTKLRQKTNRMRPAYCFSSHPSEKPGSCGGIRSSSSSGTVSLFFCSQFFGWWIRRRFG